MALPGFRPLGHTARRGAGRSEQGGPGEHNDEVHGGGGRADQAGQTVVSWVEPYPNKQQRGNVGQPVMGGRANRDRCAALGGTGRRGMLLQLRRLPGPGSPVAQFMMVWQRYSLYWSLTCFMRCSVKSSRESMIHLAAGEIEGGADGGCGSPAASSCPVRVSARGSHGCHLGQHSSACAAT